MKKCSNESQSSSVSSMYFSPNSASSLNKNIEDASDTESFTDVSSIIETKSSLIHYDEASNADKMSINSESTIQTKTAELDQVISDAELFQSLVDYANSFNFGETVYSILNKPLAGQRISPSVNDKKCVELNESVKKSVKRESAKVIPSYYVSVKAPANNHHYNYYFADGNKDDQHSDENTTIPDASNFEWEYLSVPLDNLDQSLKDGEESTAESFSTETLCTPIIIYEKTKNATVEKDMHSCLIDECTLPIRPVHIIIREIFCQDSLKNESNLSQKMPQSSTTSNRFYSIPKLFTNSNNEITYKSIASQQNVPYIDQSSKQIVIEYDQINVTVDKTIRQKKEIKRVNPDQYIQQHGNSLYSNKAFQDLLSKIIS